MASVGRDNAGAGMYARTPRDLHEMENGRSPRLIDRGLALAFGSDPQGTDAVAKAGYVFFDISPPGKGTVRSDT